ncbi:MAG: GntR family transcriptional regulator, partial [Oscillibacter sp.]|nr:GntR family transcriptional regulator [Oscillibacter sp.]
VGTIINRHVLDVHTRMDIEVEFLDMIRQNGFTPAVASVRFWEEPADEKTAAQLQLPQGTPMLRVSRLCTADGRPAIYCEDVIEKALIREHYTEEDLKPPIFHFLQQSCGIYPYLDLTDLRAVPADGKLADILQVGVGTPLLYMEEVDFDIDGKPVFCSAEYFADGIFRHTVLRKKL